ncbi:MAG: hypothetical protein NZ733_02950 [Aigarchaeota archaeon]|nr:hypothetical protein [Aigarchaeota archaeon]MCS7127371.1 hypothetical protein [Candidatus Calditenuaceae archaeon]MDW8042840.1 Sjogren's syndrome/scleroderma autoantigen 1 family protein [Nitrososphaerota archaeon]
MDRLGGDERVKRLAAALKSGAKLRTESCPECGSPLVEVKGEVMCAVCEKPVVIVRDETEAGRAVYPYVLSALEEVAVAKIDELTRILARTGDPDEIERLAEAIDALITVLRKGMELQESLKRKE